MKPTRKMLLGIVQTYYDLRPENACGGRLHIVLDDGNYGDACVEFCQKYAAEEGDHDGAWLANVFRSLSVQERIERYHYPWAQLESLEEHGIEVTRDYVLQRRAHWLAENEAEYDHWNVQAIESCDDWLDAQAGQPLGFCNTCGADRTPDDEFAAPADRCVHCAQRGVGC